MTIIITGKEAAPVIEKIAGARIFKHCKPKTPIKINFVKAHKMNEPLTVDNIPSEMTIYTSDKSDISVIYYPTAPPKKDNFIVYCINSTDNKIPEYDLLVFYHNDFRGDFSILEKKMQTTPNAHCITPYFFMREKGLLSNRNYGIDKFLRKLAFTKPTSEVLYCFHRLYKHLKNYAEKFFINRLENLDLKNEFYLEQKPPEDNILDAIRNRKKNMELKERCTELVNKFADTNGFDASEIYDAFFQKHDGIDLSEFSFKREQIDSCLKKSISFALKKNTFHRGLKRYLKYYSANGEPSMELFNELKDFITKAAHFEFGFN